MPSELVLVSNRGPVSFRPEADGSFTANRGVGGLVTAVTSAVRDGQAVWVAATLSEGDRARAADPSPILGEPAPGVEVRLVTLDEPTLAGYYREASNRGIWFACHAGQGADVPMSAWIAYREANEAFAEEAARSAAPGATVLVQDYHLCLVPALLRERRPDLAISVFWHIPFATPDGWQSLGPIAGDLVAGLSQADAVAFHSSRWAERFDAVRDTAGTTGRAQTAVLPLGVSADALVSDARSPRVAAALARMDRYEDRRLVVRADRIEPAKGVPDGLEAFELVLERRPDLHGAVVHLVRLTSSRGEIPEYVEERRVIEELAARINDRFATSDWIPVEIVVEDDFSASLAAYRRYDVLLVSSRADGMNLVAREGPIVNERDGILVLSRGAGAAEAYADGGALLVEPGDVNGIAEALVHALDADAETRRRIAAEAKERAPGMPPDAWLDAQIRLARAGR